MEVEKNEIANEVDPTILEGAIEQGAIEEENLETPLDTKNETDLEAGSEEETAPAYEPTFKYKVRDEEHEMEDWAKAFIKDEDTEKKFVEMYTRQHGLELAKTEREEYKGKFSELESAVLHVSKLANEGQIGRFIEELGLSKQVFLDYAKQEEQYKNLPEEHRREIDAQRMQERNIEQQNLQYQTMQESFQAQQVKLRQMELNTSLMKPEYAEAERLYDQSVGTPGSFRKFVAERGHYHWTVNKTDIGVDQAIKEAMQISRLNVETSPAQTGNVGTQSNPVQQANKKVIPNFRAGGTSPAKKAFTSIDQIREYNNAKR